MKPQLNKHLHILKSIKFSSVRVNKFDVNHIARSICCDKAAVCLHVEVHGTVLTMTLICETGDGVTTQKRQHTKRVTPRNNKQ